MSGSIDASELVAVMGPSGAGKSTFMNVLCGRAFYGEVTGEIRINGKVDRMENHRDLMGFVPQDDIVHEDLTVKENLIYAANLRLPTSTTRKEKLALVEATLKMLQIYHVRHSIVGSVSKRGISGGQRKRVNIGMELVAKPAALFLDEPTSGLDSTSSEVILDSLKRLTRFGMTVITVIHQPRYSIFRRFDRVLLLGKGGRTVYEGPSERAQDYFLNLGFKCPDGENVADFLMDVMSGGVRRLPVHKIKPTPAKTISRRISTSGNDGDLTSAASVRTTSDEISEHEDAPKRFDPGVLFDEWIKHSRNYRKRSKASTVSSTSETPPRHTRNHSGSIAEVGLLSSEILVLERCFIDSLTTRSSTFQSVAEVDMFMHHVSIAVIDNEIREEKALLLSQWIAEHSWKTMEAKDSKRRRKVDSSMTVHNLIIRFLDWLEKQEAAALDRAKVAAPRAKLKHRGMPAFYWQVLVIMMRYGTKKLRATSAIVLDVVLLIFAAGIVGSIIGTKFDLSFILAMNSVMTIIAFGCLCTVSSLSTFSADRVVFWREAGSGMSITAYFVARNIIDLIFVAGLRPAVFASLIYDMTQPNIDRSTYLLIFMSISWANSGLGYMLGAFIPPANVQLASVLATFILGAFFSGVIPKLSDIYRSGGIQYAGLKISYAYYALNSMLTTNINNIPASFQGKAFLDHTGFGSLVDVTTTCNANGVCITDRRVVPDPEARTPYQPFLAPLMSLVIMGAVMRGIALIGLWLVNRGKMNKASGLQLISIKWKSFVNWIRDARENFALARHNDSSVELSNGSSSYQVFLPSKDKFKSVQN